MKMERISGARIDGRNLPNFTWNADLIAFDGPLLSLFKNDNDSDALFAWLDCDSRSHRWAIIDVARNVLADYLAQKISLSSVFKAAASIIVFDQFGTRKYHVVRTSWSDLPEGYRPDPESFLTDEISTAEAKKLAKDISIRYSIMLDGEIFIDDLAGIPRLYQQLYSFHYGLAHLGRTAVRSAITSLASNWKGGFSAVNLFTGLRSVIPSIHRPILRNLHYASPGHIQMDLLPEMASQIKLAIDKVNDVSIYRQIENLYKEIYKYFRENNISGFEEERAAKEKIISPEQMNDLKEFVCKFIVLLGWHHYEQHFISLDISPLAQLRVLLAYYRRLRKLLSYQLDGLIKLT